jgi:hypothetical protein
VDTKSEKSKLPCYRKETHLPVDLIPLPQVACITRPQAHVGGRNSSILAENAEFFGQTRAPPVVTVYVSCPGMQISDVLFTRRPLIVCSDTCRRDEQQSSRPLIIALRSLSTDRNPFVLVSCFLGRAPIEDGCRIPAATNAVCRASLSQTPSPQSTRTAWNIPGPATLRPKHCILSMHIFYAAEQPPGPNVRVPSLANHRIATLTFPPRE